ncbi:hypothetical protein PanWU01x14_070340 [Parasponia andersonii]|uniref:Uncharacterized protein n=1 Tax=Parasponia andersonii TaxID=3476 RepID=A0A2P5DEZ6_PARAD|nr:hypothetical protein PanWU01x14_070340 [Parasponia andersonii]
MVLYKLDFLFGGQRVEGAGFQTRKGAIGRGENGQAVGHVELVFDLVNDLSASEDADEDAETAGLVEDLGDVGWLWFGFAWRGLNQGNL